jgi:hypothetical protein
MSKRHNVILNAIKALQHGRSIRGAAIRNLLTVIAKLKDEKLNLIGVLLDNGHCPRECNDSIVDDCEDCWDKWSIESIGMGFDGEIVIQKIDNTRKFYMSDLKAQLDQLVSKTTGVYKGCNFYTWSEVDTMGWLHLPQTRVVRVSDFKRLLHKELWTWRKFNIQASINDWPEWVDNGGIIKNVDYNCFVCHAVIKAIGERDCERCPVGVKYGRCDTLDSLVSDIRLASIKDQTDLYETLCGNMANALDEVNYD